MFRQKPDPEQHYQLLANIMQKGKVDTADKARVHIRGMKKKATRFSAAVIAIAVVLYLIFPKFTFFWSILAVGAIAWAWASTYSTIRLMELYIKRECNFK
ncbi:MAG: putative membrane protein YdbT with pleckstrin-like domain [Cellvibrionaceae bacterium]|jgi:uncharacterized membrane protein YdbT with pleckstrin-like domain